MPGLSAPSDALDAAALFAPLADYRTIGLAVSGGADSLALMVLAHRFAATSVNPPRLIVYTLDHGLRPEAADEARMVVAEAQRRGMVARALRWEGPKPATGLQAAARAARYELIGAAMAVDGAEVLVTAHHLGDQAETVMMRLAHGSGLEGLRGMDAFSIVGGTTVARPLLGVDPVHLRAVVDAEGLVPAIDPSNADPGYERVRWRQIMPALATLGLDAARLAQFAQRARDADAALGLLAESALAAADETVDGRIVIGAELLAALPRAVTVRVLGRALAEVGDADKARALGAIEALTDRLLLGAPLRTTLHGCLVTVGAGLVRIEAEPLRGSRARRNALAGT